MFDYNAIQYRSTERKREMVRLLHKEKMAMQVELEKRRLHEKILGALGEILIITGHRLKQVAALPLAE